MKTIDTVSASNPFFAGLRAVSILAKAMQLVKENRSDSEEVLLANQARALVWVSVELLNAASPKPSLGFEESGSMSGPTPTDQEFARLSETLLDKAEALLDGMKPRQQATDVNAYMLFQRPDDAVKASKFAGELLSGKYNGTRYIFMFTEPDRHVYGHGIR